MSNQSKWLRYEREKKLIQDLNLPPAEYEKRIVDLARRLKV